MDRHLQRRDELFRAIASPYDVAQRHYEFKCNGCTENCCTIASYLHTLLELEELSLAEG
ncbi:MAG: hypothetical protein ACLPX5_03285 [Dissulfurispiraceae bacterium]